MIDEFRDYLHSLPEILNLELEKGSSTGYNFWFDGLPWYVRFQRQQMYLNPIRVEVRPFLEYHEGSREMYKLMKGIVLKQVADLPKFNQKLKKYSKIAHQMLPTEILDKYQLQWQKIQSQHQNPDFEQLGFYEKKQPKMKYIQLFENWEAQKKLREQNPETYDVFDEFGFFPNWNPVEHVGDGGEPNIWFVTWRKGRWADQDDYTVYYVAPEFQNMKEEFKWFEDKASAEEFFQNQIVVQIEDNLESENFTGITSAALEDRHNGTIKSIDLVGDANSPIEIEIGH